MLPVSCVFLLCSPVGSLFIVLTCRLSFYHAHLHVSFYHAHLHVSFYHAHLSVMSFYHAHSLVVPFYYVNLLVVFLSCSPIGCVFFVMLTCWLFLFYHAHPLVVSCHHAHLLVEYSVWCH